ncbi:hypothetical protein M8J76_011736 [Diaphorina citri]|nr:hypothetical protein M8J75_008112 [Diaphorina citri]KAI5730250.1 hypothetical protein M8J76_011736 [Diaphorina citri]
MWPVLGLLVVLLSARLTQTKPPGQYAAILRSFGGPEKFSIEDYWPIPEDFKDDECWILVKAAAVYPWDKWARFNNGTRARLKAPVVIGQEVSGIVIQCGKGVTHLEQGARVFAKMPNYQGGYSQIVTTKGNETFNLPENFTHEEGAVSYYPFVVAHKALIHRAQISRGKSIFIIGGNRDVGAAAIQIAKAYGMYPIVASAGTEAGMKFMKDRGADHVLDHRHPNFRATAQFMNHFQKFDVVLNNRFPDEHYIDIDFCKNPGGYALFHDMMDIEVETKGAQYYKDTMFHEPEDCKASVDHIVKGLHEGLYRPHINKTFYLDQVIEAHQEMEDPDILGDFVLSKVHLDAYIHLSNCDQFGKKDAPRPVTYVGTINFSDPTPTLKIGMYRFNFTPANSAEQRSISQYIFTLAVEEFYGGTTPTPSAELKTYSFESLYDSEDLRDMSKHGNYDADSASQFFGKKTRVLGEDRIILRRERERNATLLAQKHNATLLAQKRNETHAHGTREEKSRKRRELEAIRI